MSTHFAAGGPSVRRSGSRACSNVLRRPPGAPAALPGRVSLISPERKGAELPRELQTRTLGVAAELGLAWDALGSQKYGLRTMHAAFIIDARRRRACRHRADHDGEADPLLPFPINHTPCVGSCSCSSAELDWATVCYRLMIATTKHSRRARAAAASAEVAVREVGSLFLFPKSRVI